MTRWLVALDIEFYPEVSVVDAESADEAVRNAGYDEQTLLALRDYRLYATPLEHVVVRES